MFELPEVPAGAIDNHSHPGPHSRFFQPGTTAEGLVRTLDRVGIGQACVCSTVSIALDVHAGNDRSLSAAHAFPDRLLAHLSRDPNRTQHEIEAELDRVKV